MSLLSNVYSVASLLVIAPSLVQCPGPLQIPGNAAAHIQFAAGIVIPSMSAHIAYTVGMIVLTNQCVDHFYVGTMEGTNVIAF